MRAPSKLDRLRQKFHRRSDVQLALPWRVLMNRSLRAHEDVVDRLCSARVLYPVQVDSKDKVP